MLLYSVMVVNFLINPQPVLRANPHLNEVSLRNLVFLSSSRPKLKWRHVAKDIFTSANTFIQERQSRLIFYLYTPQTECLINRAFSDVWRKEAFAFNENEERFFVQFEFKPIKGKRDLRFQTHIVRYSPQYSAGFRLPGRCCWLISSFAFLSK